MTPLRQFLGFGQLRLYGASCASAVVMAACGGGGSDATPPPAQPAFSQADLKHIAGLGTLTAIRTRTDVAAGIAMVGAALENTSTSPNGSGTQTFAPSTCAAGGSYSMSVVKPTAHAGIRSGDQVALSFAKCSFNGSLVYDGLAKVTAKSTVALPLTSAYSATFDADLSGFTASRNGGSTVAYTGVITATSTAAVSRLADAFNVTASVPSGTTFVATISTGSAPFRIAYAAGTTFDVTGSFTSNLAELKLDGNVDAGSAGAVTSMIVATPTKITGPIPSGAAAFVATAGAIAVKATATNGTAANLPATSTVIGGATVTVSGDADLDGSLETVFATTWADLIAP